ncbi:wax ester/triacylglycerol synthase domain-containing protein [Arthrobacter sp. 9MFCol3.1]|uniref:wax ester/triacylglycerol synthase domain-containing protein n=1 Tax=Arthrobacter sp. 9MFCol3.1 TaxID=1150398 RepID=UPI00047E5170|nr:wax ester/triacylglycerol synthase domain-containing protein [Arthrobacter sp. 9MFCol3.1]
MTPRQHVDRVSAEDMMSLDADIGSAPMQVGAILMLSEEGGEGPAPLLDALAHRLGAVPRLRQRLVSVPFGCGRSIWAEDSGFDPAQHLGVIACPAGGEEAVLNIAAEMLATPLSHDRPLWSAKLITGVSQDLSALVVVFHHVLTDGIGGLAVLEALAAAEEGWDGRRESEIPYSALQLAIDAARSRFNALARLPAALRTAAAGASELRQTGKPRAARTSLNRPTGPQRTLTVLRCDVEAVRTAAHVHGATINDLILTAVATALHRVLLARGEYVEEFVISVLFSARRHTTVTYLGNRSGIIPVTVPAVGPTNRRLAKVAATMMSVKQRPPGASTAIIGPVSRIAAHLGAYRFVIDHQHLVHTFVTNLRGPERALEIAGRPVTGIIPLGAISGNVTVAFAVLSYAGTLTITAIADPETCPDLTRLRDELSSALEALMETGPA